MCPVVVPLNVIGQPKWPPESVGCPSLKRIRGSVNLLPVDINTPWTWKLATGVAAHQLLLLFLDWHSMAIDMNFVFFFSAACLSFSVAEYQPEEYIPRLLCPNLKRCQDSAKVEVLKPSTKFLTQELFLNSRSSQKKKRCMYLNRVFANLFLILTFQRTSFNSGKCFKVVGVKVSDGPVDLATPGNFFCFSVQEK